MCECIEAKLCFILLDGGARNDIMQSSKGMLKLEAGLDGWKTITVPLVGWWYLIHIRFDS